MGKPKVGKAPKIDPMQMISLQEKYNRVNTSGPFGSQTYRQGPDGKTEFVTEMSPQMQAIFDKAQGVAQQATQKYQGHPALQGLIDQYAQRVANRRVK